MSVEEPVHPLWIVAKDCGDFQNKPLPRGLAIQSHPAYFTAYVPS